ncbi:hypothetical protein Ancab_017420 [Ancistrocladus abbreviatus]
MSKPERKPHNSTRIAVQLPKACQKPHPSSRLHPEVRPLCRTYLCYGWSGQNSASTTHGRHRNGKSLQNLNILLCLLLPSSFFDRSATCRFTPISSPVFYYITPLASLLFTLLLCLTFLDAKHSPPFSVSSSIIQIIFNSSYSDTIGKGKELCVVLVVWKLSDRGNSMRWFCLSIDVFRRVVSLNLYCKVIL